MSFSKQLLAVATLASLVQVGGILPAARGDCPSFADVEGREARLEKRIAEGQDSGKITEKQAERLRHSLDTIVKRVARCRAGQHLSTFEANEINNEMDSVSRSISHALKSPTASKVNTQTAVKYDSNAIQEAK